MSRSPGNWGLAEMAWRSEPETTFTVMCIDDNELLIDALERRLELEADFRGLYRVERLDDAVMEARRARPTIVLLDVDLPGGLDAMQLLAELVATVPDSRVIMFTGYPSGHLVARSMAAGAWGFVSKGVSSDRLISSVLRVVAGEAVIELDD